MKLKPKHRIIARVEIECALGIMALEDGIDLLNNNSLQNVSKNIDLYVKNTYNRLHSAKPAFHKVAGTNAEAMFDLLFEIANKEYIETFILALEKEIELKPNSRVLKEIDKAKLKLNFYS